MAHDSDSHYEFYAPWPLLGKRFSAQLGEIRQNMEELHPVVRYSATYDKSANGPKDSRLRGWEYGDTSKHNRFRTISDTDQEWKIQSNLGTEQVPDWHTVMSVSNSMAVAFYGPVGSIAVTTTNGLPNIRSGTIIFDRNTFYITTNSQGKPIVNLLDDDSNYSVPIDVDDGINEYLSVGNISFSHTGFYLSRGSIGQPVVNSLNIGTGGGSAIAVDDAINQYPSISKLSFAGGTFYLSRGSAGQPVVNLIGTLSTPAATANVLLTFSTPLKEWVATHNLSQTPIIAQIFDNDFRVIQPHEQDVSNPNISYFYFTDDTSGYGLFSTGGSAATGITSHSGLTGLAADDHPQYLLASGSRHATGNFVFDANATVTGLLGVTGISNLDGQVLANDGFSATGVSSFFGNVDVYDRVKADHFIGGGFYFSDDLGEAISGVQATDGVITIKSPNLHFNRASFYLTPDSQGNPVVNFKHPIVASGTTSVTFTDGVVTIADDTLHFNRSSFYLTPDSTGNPVLNFKHPIVASGSTSVNFTDGVKLFTDDTIRFNRTSFYLTPAKSTGDPVLNFKHDLNKSIQRGATWVKGGSLAVVASEAPTVQVYIPNEVTITGVELLTNGGTGSCVVDIWHTSYGNYPPTVANSITASAKPTITSGIKNKDTTLSGWKKRIPADSVLTFKLSSSATFTLVSCTLTLQT
jgi:hypothetical protein